MPPRRSTRSSARLTAGPENNPPPQKPVLSSKRKRSSGDNTDIEGQEEPSKLPSRTTRHSSSKAAPSAPASRASSRSKNVSHQVRDSDDQDEDGELSHSNKRPRKSHELEDVHEEDEEEDIKPTIRPKTRRAASRPVASTNGKTGKEQVVPAEDEPEEQITAKPTSRPHSSGKHSSSSKPSTSGRGGRPTRSAAVRVKAEPPEEPTLENTDDADGEEIQISATSQRKTATRSSRKVKSSTPPQSVGNEDSGDDTYTGDNANATAVVPNGSVASGSFAEQPAPVPSLKKLPSIMPPAHEEEKSLLDDLPTSPSKAKRGPAPLEEPQGPRPRLVIHKLVLVNFKSYAGRQEIGPFHKVGCFYVMLLRLITCSLFLQSSGPMVLASRILSMHCFLCLVTVPVRCDKENSPNSYIIRHNTRICKSAV